MRELIHELEMATESGWDVEADCKKQDSKPTLELIIETARKTPADP